MVSPPRSGKGFFYSAFMLKKHSNLSIFAAAYTKIVLKAVTFCESTRLTLYNIAAPTIL